MHTGVTYILANTRPFSRFVESGFWNFDALFVPQQHPARDLQDTFYISDPQAADVPRPTSSDDTKDYAAYWDNVKAVHQVKTLSPSLSPLSDSLRGNDCADDMSLARTASMVRLGTGTLGQEMSRCDWYSGLTRRLSVQICSIS